jgi:hypothetical protein
MVENSQIFDNAAAERGGGVYNEGGILSHCKIYNNIITDGSGGGIANIFGKVYNCEIHSNYSELVGGGIFNVTGDILNCILYDNFASGSGGGISTQCVFYPSRIGKITNCTVFKNSSLSGFGGIDGSELEIDNCICVNNENGDLPLLSGWVYYSCFGEATGANGNINADPLFVNALGANSVWDFRLQKNSPCIDAGNPDESFNDGCIPPGRKTSRNDMGAFGGPLNCLWLDDVTTGVIADILLGRDDISSPTIPYIDQNADERLDISDLVILMLFK